METKLPVLNVATVGHTRHGKTTVAAALTRVLAGVGGHLPMSIYDIAKGSIRRGQRNTAGYIEDTIDVGILDYRSDKRDYSHHDCPGIRKYGRNTIRTLYSTDVLILVVAADESVMPQTREHVAMAWALGVEKIVVFINKCDTVDDVTDIEIVESEVRDILDKVGYDADSTRVIRGAALPAYKGDRAWSGTIEDLADALDQEAPSRVRFDPTGPLWVQVENEYSRPSTKPDTQYDGPYACVGGVILRGTLKVGDIVELISPREERMKIRVCQLQSRHADVDSAQAGEDIGLLLGRTPTRTPIPNYRRCTLVEPGSVEPVPSVLVDLKLLPQRFGGRHTALPMAHWCWAVVNGDGVPARIELPLPMRELDVGLECEKVRLRFNRPIAVEVGMKIALSDGCDGLTLIHGASKSQRWYGVFGSARVTALESAPPAMDRVFRRSPYPTRMRRKKSLNTR